MKDYIAKHIEELIGTAVGIFTGVTIKYNTLLISIALINDLHTVAISFLTGAFGGLGALVIKMFWNWLKSKRNK